jgi:hypothetical protein
VDRRASRRLLNTSLLIFVVGSFDEFAVGEGGAGADQSNEVGITSPGRGPSPGSDHCSSTTPQRTRRTPTHQPAATNLMFRYS